MTPQLHRPPSERTTFASDCNSRLLLRSTLLADICMYNLPSLFCNQWHVPHKSSKPSLRHSMLNADIFGRESLGRVNGVVVMMSTASAGMGPLAFGWCRCDNVVARSHARTHAYACTHPHARAYARARVRIHTQHIRARVYKHVHTLTDHMKPFTLGTWEVS